jgi:ATP-dependent DNA ligase
MISMADFNKGVSELTQEQRHNGLVSLVESGIFAEAGITACEVLPKFKIDFDTPEGRAKFTELQEQVLAIRAAATEETPTAVEGLMIKRKKGPYRVGKKGTDWLKWKPYIEVTLRVTGVEYGDADKSRAGKVAALICEGEDDGVKYKTNVSSGITHDDSDAWTDDPSLIIDWMVEIAADAATQDEKAIGTDVFSLRFPRYKGKRGTKPGEKI